MKKDFLSLDDISRSEIFEIFELIEQLKKKPFGNHLSQKVFALFFRRSFLTRVSFEIGIRQLNGIIVHLNKLGQNKGKVLGRYADVIIAETSSHKKLEKIAKNIDIPIINARSDLTHPCQILSDLFTIKEKFGSFKGLKLAYVGDGNNICNSLLLGCAKVGIDISVACPKGFEPNKNIVKMAKNYTKITKSKVIVGTETKTAVKNANIIYNNTFISMGDEKEKTKRLKVFVPKYQVTNKLLKLASSDAVYMHCLPAHRGEEVTSEVIDGPRSIIFDQAENRLHTQKALLVKMMIPKIKIVY